MRSIDEKIIDLMNRKTDEAIESNELSVQKERLLERRGVKETRTLIAEDVSRLERLKKTVYTKLKVRSNQENSDLESLVEITLLKDILIDCGLTDDFNDWLKEMNKGADE